MSFEKNPLEYLKHKYLWFCAKSTGFSRDPSPERPLAVLTSHHTTPISSPSPLTSCCGIWICGRRADPAAPGQPAARSAGQELAGPSGSRG